MTASAAVGAPMSLRARIAWLLTGALIAAVSIGLALQGPLPNAGASRAVEPGNSTESVRAAADGSLGAPVRIVPITAYAGNELAPALSPDGESVVFSRDDEDGNLNLHVARIGGPGAAQLTNAPEPDRFPVWSPDGAHIAFLRQIGPNAFHLIIIPAVGGRERQISTVFIRPRDIYGSPPLAWTPDSNGLVFTTRSGDDIASAHHLYRLTLATGEVQQITTGDKVYDTSPAISADSRWLAFVRHIDFLTHVRGVLIVQPISDNTEPIVVPVLSTGEETPGDAVHSPSWSPDGRYLTFVAGVNLLEWELGAAAARLVYAGRGHLGGMTPDGDISALTMVREGSKARAVVASINRSADIHALPLDPLTHEAAGPPVPRITSSAGDVSPDFSSDGRRVAFVSDREGGMDVWIAAANGADQWRVTSLQARILGYPRWSPDDERIAFHTFVGTERRVFLIDPHAGVPQPVSAGCCASWSPSGDYLFVTDVGESHTLSRVRIADGQREALFTGGFAAVTADGSRLLYGKLGEQSVYARSIAGDLRGNAEESLVTDSAYPGGITPTADGFFYFGSVPEHGSPTLRFYEYATRAARTVALLPTSGIEVSTLSPDGTELLYPAQARSVADLVLLEFGERWR
jgi:Tol biopolymer transport system component